MLIIFKTVRSQTRKRVQAEGGDGCAEGCCGKDASDTGRESEEDDTSSGKSEIQDADSNRSPRDPRYLGDNESQQKSPKVTHKKVTTPQQSQSDSQQRSSTIVDSNGSNPPSDLGTTPKKHNIMQFTTRLPAYAFVESDDIGLREVLDKHFPNCDDIGASDSSTDESAASDSSTDETAASDSRTGETAASVSGKAFRPWQDAADPEVAHVFVNVPAEVAKRVELDLSNERFPFKTPKKWLEAFAKQVKEISGKSFFNDSTLDASCEPNRGACDGYFDYVDGKMENGKLRLSFKRVAGSLEDRVAEAKLILEALEKYPGARFDTKGEAVDALSKTYSVQRTTFKDVAELNLVGYGPVSDTRTHTVDSVYEKLAEQCIRYVKVIYSQIEWLSCVSDRDKYNFHAADIWTNLTPLLYKFYLSSQEDGAYNSHAKDAWVRTAHSLRSSMECFAHNDSLVQFFQEFEKMNVFYTEMYSNAPFHFVTSASRFLKAFMSSNMHEQAASSNKHIVLDWADDSTFMGAIADSMRRVTDDTYEFYAAGIFKENKENKEALAGTDLPLDTLYSLDSHKIYYLNAIEKSILFLLNLFNRSEHN